MRPIYDGVQLTRNVLTAEECEALIAASEHAGFAKMAGDYPGGYRDNDRAVRDDAELAAWLFARISAALPAALRDEQGQLWSLIGLNDRFRLCRYRGGQSFTRHRDGAHARGDGARSFLTCQIYLNDGGEFAGGRTRFFASPAADAPMIDEVGPERGAMIVFDHRAWHDGEAVTIGTKYVLRTDAMYTPRGGTRAPREHDGYVWSMSIAEDGTIATGSRDRTIRIWSGEQWAREQILSGHSASVTALVHTRDRALWSGSRDRTLRRWAQNASAVADTGACVLALAAFADDVVIATSAGTIERWSPAMTRAAGAVASSGWVRAVVRHGDAIASAGDDGTLRLWRAFDLTPIAALELDAPLCSLASRGDRLFAASARGTITEVAATDDRLHVLQRWRAHDRAIDALAIVGTDHLASGGEDCAVRVWNAAAMPAATFLHEDFVRALAWDPRIGLVSAGYDRRVRITPLKDGADASGDE